MNARFPTSVDAITPEQVRDFLERKGWRDRQHRNTDIFVMDGEIAGTGRRASLVSPVDPTMDDYPARLRDALVTMADGFDMSVAALVDAILFWDRDIYRIRLQSPAQREQLLPLCRARYRKVPGLHCVCSGNTGDAATILCQTDQCRSKIR